MPTTTYMSLILPVVSTTPGPDFASQIGTAFGVVDAHDHSSGKGVPVTQLGINLTGNLSMNGFALTSVLSVRANEAGAISAISAPRAIYVNGGELYYNDSAGNAVKLTSAGAVNTGATGNISGMDATSALTYSTSTKTFTFTQSSGFPAKIASGDVVIYPTVAAAGNAINIINPNVVGYSLTLPVGLPTTTALIQVSGAGIMSTVTPPAGATALLQGTSGGANSWVTTLPSALTIPGPTITGTVAGGASYTAPALTSPTITGTTSIGAGATITSPTLVTPKISGAIDPTTWPSFDAYRATNQTITGIQKISIDTEVFDTNNNFDPTTNYRFTPTIAGKYQFNLSAVFDVTGAAGSIVVISIHKNGFESTAIQSAMNTLNTTQRHFMYCGGLIEMNGTTDYVEAYAGNGSSVTVTLFGGAANFNHFSGSRVA